MGVNAGHVITGETEDEVSQNALAHVKEAHADLPTVANTPENMADMEKVMRSNIK